MIMHALKAAVSVALLVMVIALVAINYDTAQVFQDIRGLSPAIMALIAAALLANALAAVLRFQVIATEVRHPIGFRRAMAVVGAGSLGGAVFFQLAGQLMARGMIASRGGIPFAAVVVITAYERFIAAIVSALIALASLLPAYLHHHRKIHILLLFLSGFGFLVFARLFLEENLAWNIPFILAGAIFISAAHLINFRLCRKCRECCEIQAES